jgi:uncharacterized protein (DUF433 family)
MQLALESEMPPLREDAHGVIRIGRTRVTLESIVSLFEQGASAEEIALRFEVLELHEIYATLSYYLGHRHRIQDYLERQRQASAWARLASERRSPTGQVRERLARYRKDCDAQAAD